MQLKPGMLVKSKAGRDKGRIYVIIRVEQEYVYVADGVLRPLRRQKKKNRMHLQPILRMHMDHEPDDTAICNIIKELSRQGDQV